MAQQDPSHNSQLPPTRHVCLLEQPQSAAGPLNVAFFYGASPCQLHREPTCLQSNSDVTVDSESSQCVTTPDLEEADDLLADIGRVVLCGLPGTGKTMVGLALLRRWRDKGFTTYIFSSVEDWNTNIKTGEKSVVLMDGTLGEVHADMTQHHRWKAVLGSVLELTDRGDCKVIITLYPHVLRKLELLESNAKSPLKDKTAVIRLMETILDKATKENLLTFHASRLNLDPSQTRKLIKTVLQKDTSGPAFIWCCHRMAELLQSSPDGTDIFTQPAEAYAPLLVQMLNEDCEAVLAALALTMKGFGNFLHRSSETKAELHRLHFDRLSLHRLTEVADVLKGSFLLEKDTGFVSRVLYDAAGLAIGRVRRFATLFKVCDVTFLVQHVRTHYTQSELSHGPEQRVNVTVGLLSGHSEVDSSDAEDFQCLVERIHDEIVDGRQLTKIAQHPSLRCTQFLAELEKYSKGKNTTKGLISVVDSEHKLPLVYWSAVYQSINLTRWCLRLMAEAKRNLSVLPRVLLVYAIFYPRAGHLNSGEDSLSFCFLMPQTLKGFTDIMTICLPKLDDYLTRETQHLRNFIQVIESRQTRWYYLGDSALPVSTTLVSVQVHGDKVNVQVKDQQDWYLVLRLLCDRVVDDTDPDGNSLLHVAADVGNLEAIKLAVESGASLTRRNEQGLTPYQVAHGTNRKRKKKEVKAERDLFSAIREGDVVSVKALLCHSYDVHEKDQLGNTSLDVACSYGHRSIVELLLELGARLNILPLWTNTHITVLHYACLNGWSRTVELLQNHQADVNTTTADGRTALHFACECASSTARTDITRLLLDSGANVNVRSNNGDIPLHYACRQGYTNTAELLILRGADVNMPIRAITTPLCVAMEHRQSDMIELLIRHGADVNFVIRPLHAAYETKNAQVITLLLDAGVETSPLHQSAARGDVDVVTTLIRQGADVNKHDSNLGCSPLHVACVMGNRGMVLCLIEHGADVCNNDENNDTPLHVACQLGHNETALCLIHNKADINAKNKHDNTALHVACQSGHNETAHCLIQNRADMNAKDTSGDTPLHVACRSGHTETALCLICNKADINAKNKHGNTPLHVACQSGHNETALCLIRNKADINAKNKHDNTALHVACQSGHNETAHCLIQNRADINAKDISGDTPLHVACRSGHTETALCLICNEADINAKNDFGNTPLYAACMSGHTETVLCLTQNKAM